MPRVMDFALPLALTAFQATVGFIVVFGVIFPAVVTGLILFSAAQAANEHQQNLDDLDGVTER